MKKIMKSCKQILTLSILLTAIASSTTQSSSSASYFSRPLSTTFFALGLGCIIGAHAYGWLYESKYKTSERREALKKMSDYASSLSLQTSFLLQGGLKELRSHQKQRIERLILKREAKDQKRTKEIEEKDKDYEKQLERRRKLEKEIVSTQLRSTIKHAVPLSDRNNDSDDDEAETIHGYNAATTKIPSMLSQQKTNLQALKERNDQYKKSHVNQVADPGISPAYITDCDKQLQQVETSWNAYTKDSTLEKLNTVLQNAEQTSDSAQQLPAEVEREKRAFDNEIENIDFRFKKILCGGIFSLVAAGIAYLCSK